MLHIVFCDDNKKDLANLEALLYRRYGEGGARLASFSHPDAAYDYVENRGDVDILLLDILMPGRKGTELALQLREAGYRGYIVFLTSSNDFAAESYASDAFSYLLKPIRPDNLYPKLDNIEDEMTSKDSSGVAVKVGHNVRRILYGELVYLEAQSHKSHFHLKNGDVVASRKAFSDYASQLLKDSRFAVCHSSFLVNMDYVQELEPRDVVLRSGDIIPIAKREKDFHRVYMKRLIEGGHQL